LNPLRDLRDWCRRPSKIRLYEGHQPLIVGTGPKKGVILVLILAIFALFARISPIELTGPMGYLSFIILFSSIFWYFEFFNLGHKELSDGWRERDYKTWKLTQDMWTCEKCGAGHDEISADLRQGMYKPFIVKCKRCGHEWIYTVPGYKL